MQITRAEYVKKITEQLENRTADEQTDGSEFNQLIIYTNVFVWKDGTYHTDLECKPGFIPAP